MRRGKVPSVAHMNMHGHRRGCGNAYGFTGAQDVVTHSMAHPHHTHTRTPNTAFNQSALDIVSVKHKRCGINSLEFPLHFYSICTQRNTDTHTYVGTHTVSWAQACGTVVQNTLLVIQLRKADSLLYKL